jgi:hypothetical protein
MPHMKNTRNVIACSVKKSSPLSTSVLYDNEKVAAYSVRDKLKLYQFALIFALCRTGKSNASIYGALHVIMDLSEQFPTKKHLLINISCDGQNASVNQANKDHNKALRKSFKDPILNWHDFTSSNEDLVDDIRNIAPKIGIITLNRTEVDPSKKRGESIIEVINQYLNEGNFVFLAFDECDVGDNKNGTIDSFCQALNIDRCEYTSNRDNLYVSLVSATPPAEFALLKARKKMGQIVYIPRPRSFTSLSALDKAGRIRICPKLTEKIGEEHLMTDDGKALLKSLPHGKVSIMRNKSANKTNGIIRQEAQKHGIRVEFVNSEVGRNGGDVKKLYKKYKGGAPLLILVKNNFSRGLQLKDTRKLGFIIEEVDPSNESSGLQRASRACGYGNQEDSNFILFLPSRNKLGKFIAYEESIVKIGEELEELCLLSGTHSRSNMSNVVSHNFTYVVKPEYESEKDFLSSKRLTRESPRENRSEDKDIFRHIINEQVKGGVTGESAGRARKVSETLGEDHPDSHAQSEREFKNIIRDPDSSIVANIIKAPENNLKSHQEVLDCYDQGFLYQVILRDTCRKISIDPDASIIKITSAKSPDEN